MKRFWFLMLAVVLTVASGAFLAACTSGDDDDDDDDDVSEECDLEVLAAQTEELCGGTATYTGQAESDDACGATCGAGDVGYWYDTYGACTNECFCCA